MNIVPSPVSFHPHWHLWQWLCSHMAFGLQPWWPLWYLLHTFLPGLYRSWFSQRVLHSVTLSGIPEKLETLGLLRAISLEIHCRHLYPMLLVPYQTKSKEALQFFLGSPWEVRHRLTLVFDPPNLLMFSFLYVPGLYSNRWLLKHVYDHGIIRFMFF